MGWRSVLVLVAVVAGQSPELPPPFPRPGTTKLLENDAVAVWDVSWLKQQYPLHTHRYDLVGVSYVEGDRIITQGNGPGRLVNTKAWVFQTNRASVTHVEEGASDPPMRAVLIEVKSAAPREAVAERRPTACARPPALRPSRTAVRPPGRSRQAPPRPLIATSATPWSWSSTARRRKRRLYPAGTVHAGPAAGDGGRAFIFEIK